MTPEQAEALAMQIIADAALADGEVAGAEPPAHSEALEAASAVEAALREVSGAPAVARVAEADDGTDLAWFTARPDRTARLRRYRPDERRPYWAEEGEQLMAVVRYSRITGPPSAEPYPAEAFEGEPVADTDKAILAAARRWRDLR